ncbi:MAG: glycine cleavage system aminomethyltransferase GcvT [Deltaproteobacteria bacterium]|nr:glycine cleavage system aminomethyltransferase GcvT [Deltaproteobacteria bacterium]
MPRSTPLLDIHKSSGGRIVEFAGWLMPVQYSGIIDEHKTVRTAVGLFDVSHMGEVFFAGPRAVEAVQRVVTTEVGRLRDGEAVYTVICRPTGGIVDDCIVYRRRQDQLFIVVNASNEVKDYTWLAENAGGIARVTNRSADFALIAVQGPKAVATLCKLTKLDLPAVKYFGLVDGEIAGMKVTAARTGYTGEDGFEVFTSPVDAPKMWGALMEAGKEFGVKPAGLGARDTLRLEARMCLYGNDITDETTPLEAGLNWVVKLDAGDFIGREALQKQKAGGVRRKLVGFVIRERAIARHGYPILAPEAARRAAPSAAEGVRGAAEGRSERSERAPDGPPGSIGVVTSGTSSPTLGYSIGMGYVPTELSQPGQKILCDCRGKLASAEIVKGPFYKRPA